MFYQCLQGCQLGFGNLVKVWEFEVYHWLIFKTKLTQGLESLLNFFKLLFLSEWQKKLPIEHIFMFYSMHILLLQSIWKSSLSFTLLNRATTSTSVTFLFTGEAIWVWQKQSLL